MNKILVLIVLIIAYGVTNAQWVEFEHNIVTSTNGIAGIYACDIDNDEDIDIVVGEIWNHRISLFRNNGGNPFQWTYQIIGYPFYSAASVYCADFDGDGLKDIAGVARNGGEVAWWRNPGDSTSSWAKQTIKSGYFFPHEVFSYDFDSDGDMDVFVANSGLSRMDWWRNDGGNPIAWVEQTIASGFSQAKSARLADIDGDGDLDVVGAALGSNDVTWWRNDGGNPITWTAFLINGNFAGAHKVDLVDIDNDGMIDVLGAAYWGGEIAWWRNEGGNPISWTKQTIGAGFVRACEALAVDIDNDGNLDVVGTAQGNNELAFWHNEGGNPIVWSKYMIDNLPSPWPLFVIDMNNNGRQDIISAGAWGDAQVTSWLKWYSNEPPTPTSVPEILSYVIQQNLPPNDTSEIFLINSDGTGKTQLTNQPGLKPYSPAFSPDASQIAFYNHANYTTWSLWVMNSDGSNMRRLTSGLDTLDWLPRWSPDGNKIIFTRSFMFPVWRSEIWTLKPDGTNQVRIGNVDGEGAEYSPDGSKIIYSTYFEGGGDVWIMNADGTNPVQLTNNPSEDWHPRFSPDGSKIAFESMRDGNFEIYVMNSNGSNQIRLTNNSAEDRNVDWSPDGSRIAFVSERDSHSEIYIMNADGTNQVRLTYTNGRAINPDWMPVDSSTEVSEDSSPPKGFYLSQNYPNPFNPSTKISYQIPELGFVTLKIYDVLGNELATLVNEEKPAGKYEINLNTADLPSGIYFYKLETESYLETKKMILLK